MHLRELMPWNGLQIFDRNVLCFTVDEANERQLAPGVRANLARRDAARRWIAAVTYLYASATSIDWLVSPFQHSMALESPPHSNTAGPVSKK